MLQDAGLSNTKLCPRVVLCSWKWDPHTAKHPLSNASTLLGICIEFIEEPQNAKNPIVRNLEFSSKTTASSRRNTIHREFQHWPEFELKSLNTRKMWKTQVSSAENSPQESHPKVSSLLL
jgi:protein tyrosine phosphatase